MRLFVTGATGLLGRRLVRLLVERGHAVVALARNTDRARSMLPPQVSLHPGDVTDRNSLRPGMEEADGVFHLAAWYQVGGRRGGAEEVNVAGTRNVLETAEMLAVPRTIYTSTLAVFSHTGGRAVDETYRYRGRHLSEYDRTKWLAHYQVAEPMIERGLPLIILQPGVVYGPGDTSPSGRAIRDYLRRRLPAVPLGTAYCWGHLDDTVRVHLEAMERGRPGETYIVAGPPHSLVEALEIAEGVTGIRAPRMRLPAALLRGAASLVGLAGPVSERAAGAAELLRVGAGVTYLGDSSKARRELGWAPRSLVDGFGTVLPEMLAEMGMAPV